MVAVDTNVVVRLLTGDEQRQYTKAVALFENHEVFLPDSVVLETEWVLRYAYEFSGAEICTAFRKLFGLTNVHLSDPARMARAIAWHEQGLDFADALHLAQAEPCERFFTFDAKFIRKSRGLARCTVIGP